MLASAHHVGQVTHDAAHVSFVDVCEKALVRGRVVGILEEPTCGWGEGLDIPLSVEGKNGNVRNFVVLEALPFLLRKRGG